MGEVIEVIWGSDGVEEPWRGCGLPPGREAEARPPVTTRQVDKSPLLTSYLFTLTKFAHQKSWFWSSLTSSYLLPFTLLPLTKLGSQKNCVFVLWKFCHLVTGEQDTSHLCNELNFVFNPNFVTDLILYFLGEIWPPSQKLKFGQQNNNALVT